MTLLPFKMKWKIYRNMSVSFPKEKKETMQNVSFMMKHGKELWMESRPSFKMTKTQRTHMHLYMCMHVFLQLSIYGFCCLDSFLWAELRIIDWLLNISYLPLKLLQTATVLPAVFLSKKTEVNWEQISFNEICEIIFKKYF